MQKAEIILVHNKIRDTLNNVYFMFSSENFRKESEKQVTVRLLNSEDYKFPVGNTISHLRNPDLPEC